MLRLASSSARALVVIKILLEVGKPSVRHLRLEVMKHVPVEAGGAEDPIEQAVAEKPRDRHVAAFPGRRTMFQKLPDGCEKGEENAHTGNPRKRGRPPADRDEPNEDDAVEGNAPSQGD